MLRNIPQELKGEPCAQLNEQLLGTIKVPYGNHNLRQISTVLPKANYDSIRRNSSVPGLNGHRRQPSEPLRENGRISRGNSQIGAHNDIRTPGNKDKMIPKKVAPVGLPPIDQKHLRRGGE